MQRALSNLCSLSFQQVIHCYDIYAIHEGKVICYYMKEKCINGIVVAYCILFLERGHRQVVAYCILLACNSWDPIVFACVCVMQTFGKHLANIWQIDISRLNTIFLD